jgi:hypothetical protein
VCAADAPELASLVTISSFDDPHRVSQAKVATHHAAANSPTTTRPEIASMPREEITVARLFFMSPK